MKPHISKKGETSKFEIRKGISKKCLKVSGSPSLAWSVVNELILH